MVDQKAFFGGIPTDVDVNRLISAYPVEGLVSGTVIPYGDVSKVIGESYGSNRWRTVTTRWRRKVEVDHNLYIEPDTNEARQFVVLDERGKVGLSRKKLRSSVRMARRSFTISARVDVGQLTDEEKSAHEFNCSRSAAVLATGQLRRKAPSLPEV